MTRPNRPPDEPVRMEIIEADTPARLEAISLSRKRNLRVCGDRIGNVCQIPDAIYRNGIIAV